MNVDCPPSSTAFVYPFRFDSSTFASRGDAIQGATWSSRNGPHRIWKTAAFPEEDLLPQVSDYLNPEPGRAPTARLWQLDDSMAEPYGFLGRAQWNLCTPGVEIPFQFGDAKHSRQAAQLILFHTGIGFLTVRAHPLGGAAAAWFDFIHYFRFSQAQRQVSLRAVKPTGFDEEKKERIISPFFPEMAGGVAGHPDGCGTLAEVMTAWLASGQLPGERAPWWRDVFIPGQLLPYVALFVRELPVEDAGVVLYRLRNFFHFDQQIHPTVEDRRPDHPSLLPYSDRQWFSFSLDGGAFLAADAADSDFDRNVLPDHLGKAYFMLFLLALHQRFALSAISQAVADHWLVCGDHPCQEEREEAFLHLRNALLDFSARARFSQVMQREHHQRCYLRWLEVFQVDRLYEQNREQVQDMYQYLAVQREKRLRVQEKTEEQARIARDQREAENEKAAQRRAARLERLLAAIASVLGVPMVGLTFLAAIKGVDLELALAVLAVTSVVGALAYAVIFRWAMWQTPPPRPNPSDDHHT